MHISKININNYRLLNNTSINCEKDLSLIIGKNNCGKTSLLSVLNKCIGSNAEVGKFDYYDFSIVFQKKLFEVITGNAGFGVDELTGIKVDIYIEYDENDKLDNISNFLLDLDPNNKTVILRFEYVLKNKIGELKDDFKTYKDKKQNLSVMEAYDKFISKRHKKYFEFNKYSVLYDYKNGVAKDKVTKLLDSKTTDISKLISFSSISARRNVSNDTDVELSSLASSYYDRTKNAERNITIQEGFEDEVDATDKNFDQIYTETFKKLTDKLSKFGGIKERENELKVVSQIQISKLLKDNTTVVYNENENFLPEHFNGLGYLNLFSIIMKIETLLTDFRKENKENEIPSDINLLFIEEPEAHTHPQMQSVFIKNIKDLLDEGKMLGENGEKINLQTFMTTHSSHIVAESDFNDIKYFSKVKTNGIWNTTSKNLKDLEILYQKEFGEDNNRFKFLKQYLTLNRSEVFFADKIILIEGDTERILLPAMIKKLDQEKMSADSEYTALGSQNISVIEVGNYSEIYSEFIKFIGIKTLIITDIDAVKVEVDTNGKIKNIACKVDTGTHTTNSSLKFFLKDKLKDDVTKHKDILVDLKFDDKTLLIGSQNEWVSDKEGFVSIVYQTKEENNDKEYYNARSFEDAFFHVNKDFFIGEGKDDDEKKKNCKIKFQGLKNVRYFFDQNIDSYYLAENCVSKKPSLAMDILLNSKSKDGNDFTNWQTPLYIKEGLEWLQKN